jgi:hypothetical protein
MGYRRRIWRRGFGLGPNGSRAGTSKTPKFRLMQISGRNRLRWENNIRIERKRKQDVKLCTGFKWVMMAD